MMRCASLSVILATVLSTGGDAQSFDRDYSSGRLIQSNEWKFDCACKAADYQTPWDSQESCIKDFLASGQCVDKSTPAPTWYGRDWSRGGALVR